MSTQKRFCGMNAQIDLYRPLDSSTFCLALPPSGLAGKTMHNSASLWKRTQYMQLSNFKGVLHLYFFTTSIFGMSPLSCCLLARVVRLADQSRPFVSVCLY